MPTPLPPTTSGIGFRHFGGEVDFVGMVDVLNASSKADGVDRWDTVEGMTNSYRHLVNCDLDTDLLIAERDDDIVGYERVTWWIEDATADRVLLFVYWVKPDARLDGVEEAMVGWGEHRVRDLAREQPFDATQHIETFADATETSKISVIEAAGFRVAETYAQMRRSLHDPIPERPLPGGLEIRPVGAADKRRLWEADQEAFRDHVGYSPGTEEDYQEFESRPDFDPALWKVAFDGDEIAGQVLNYVVPDEIAETGRKRGWTEFISTQRKWRGRGVAKALITESMHMFKDMGLDEVTLGVHTTNPTGAFKLYEGLGYEIESMSYEYRKPF